MRKTKIILSLMLSSVLTTGLIVSAADEISNIESENIATSTTTSTVNNECDHGLTNSKIIQPACTEGGEKIEDCIYCGEIVKVTPLKPLGHDVDYNKYEVVKQPTETEYGEIVYRCERCGEIIDHGLLPKIDPTKPTNPNEDVVILPSEHEDDNDNNDNDNEDKPSTVTPINPSTVTPEEPKEDKPSAPTVVKRLKIIDKDATCTENGEWHYEVIMSDGTKIDDGNGIIKAFGHNWGGGIITTPPTYTDCGVETYTCSNCGETKTELIPQLEEINTRPDPDDDAPNDMPEPPSCEEPTKTPQSTSTVETYEPPKPQTSDSKSVVVILAAMLSGIVGLTKNNKRNSNK